MWLCPGSPAGAEEEAAEQGCEIVAEIHARAVELEDAFYRLVQRQHEKAMPERLKIVLSKAVQGQDVEMRVLVSPVIGEWAQAKIPGLNCAVHRVDITRLDRGGNGKAGTIEMSADIWFDFSIDSLTRSMMGGLKRVRGSVTLKARRKGEGFEGAYVLEGRPLPGKSEDEQGPENPLPTRRGAATIGARRLDRPLKANPGNWRPWEDAETRDLHLFGIALERAADGWYQRIRALAIARRHELRYAQALKEALVPEVVHEPMKDVKQADAERALPELDDELDEDLEGIPDRSRERSHDEAETRRALGELRRICDRVTRMWRAVATHEQTRTPASYTVDTLKTEDPEFGPWYGKEGLEVSKEGVNLLPAEAGSDGPQDWRYVSRWEALGPFPLTCSDLVTPLLPDVIHEGDEVCRSPATERKDHKGPSRFGWKRCQCRSSFGYVAPPRWYRAIPESVGFPGALGGDRYYTGLPHSTVYLGCSIESPREVELWAGLGVNREGKLWLNDRLIWHGPREPEPHFSEHVALIKIPFRRGRNRLMLRLDVDFSSPYCWLHLCLRGRPRPAAEVKAKAAAVAATRRQMKRKKIVGWRGDGNGVYPGTNPPVAWNRKQMQNVLWHTPLPYFGNATAVPVPGTNRLFVTLDPCWLLCLDKDTGRELWRRAVTLLDLLPEAERKKGWQLHEAWWKARRERDSLPVRKVPGLKYPWPKWIQYEWYWAEETGIWAPVKGKAIDGREGASPELVALLDKRDELEKAPDPSVVQDELSRVLKKIEKLQTERHGKDPNSVLAHVKRLREAQHAYETHLNAKMGGGYWSDYVGWMWGTPITDGRHVWVKVNTDVAACYDLDGNEKWKVQVGSTGSGDHALSSPCLADGKFIVQGFQRFQDERGHWRFKPGIKLVALDAGTGETVWEANDLPSPPWNCASPTVMTLTDGHDIMNVVVTQAGSVVRADDGKILVRYIGWSACYDSRVCQDDIVVSASWPIMPVQLIMKSRDRIGFRRLWAVRSGGYDNYGGCVIADDRIFLTEHASGKYTTWLADPAKGRPVRFQSGPAESWKTVGGYDLHTGQCVVRVPALRKGAHQYSPPSASGKHVYLIDGDHIFTGVGPKAPMDIVVLTREERPLRLANNAIGRCYGSAAIDGDRIYIRSYNGVTCIGYTGAAGKRYEARTVARNLLDEVFPERPGDTPVRDVPMRASSTIKGYSGHPRARGRWSCLLLNGQAPHSWWIAGPVPMALAKEALAAFGGPAEPLQGDESFRAGGKEYEWIPMTQPLLETPNFKRWEIDPAGFADIHRLRRVVDLGQAIRHTPRSTCWLMVELHSDRKQIMRFEQSLPNVRAWVGGVPIAHGDRVRFAKGLCQLLLEVRVDEIPAGGLHLSPRFWDSDDLKQETAIWEDEVNRRRPYFQKVILLAPESVEAKAAKHLLDSFSSIGAATQRLTPFPSSM